MQVTVTDTTAGVPSGARRPAAFTATLEVRQVVPDSVKVEAATARAEAVAVPVSRSREAARAAWEAAESTVICANAPVANQSLAEASLPAGVATDRHFHKLSEEFYFLLDGQGMMEIEGDHREVGPGDAILIPAGAWHQIRALTPLRFLCCCAPPYAHDDTYFA